MDLLVSNSRKFLKDSSSLFISYNPLQTTQSQFWEWAPAQEGHLQKAEWTSEQAEQAQFAACALVHDGHLQLEEWDSTHDGHAQRAFWCQGSRSFKYKISSECFVAQRSIDEKYSLTHPISHRMSHSCTGGTFTRSAMISLWAGSAGTSTAVCWNATVSSRSYRAQSSSKGWHRAESGDISGCGYKGSCWSDADHDCLVDMLWWNCEEHHPWHLSINSRATRSSEEAKCPDGCDHALVKDLKKRGLVFTDMRERVLKPPPTFKWSFQR